MKFLNEFNSEIKELSKRITIVLVVGLIGLVIGLIATPSIIDLITNFFKLNLVSLKPTDSFNAYLTISLFIALLFAFPTMLIQLYYFLKNALKENETKLVKKGITLSFFLFLIGMSIGVFVSLLSLTFFTEFSGSLGLNATWGIEYVINYISSLALVFGIIFVFIPITIYSLIKFLLIKKKSIAIGSLMCFPFLAFGSAWITPPDMFSQVALLIPIYLLVFISLILIKGGEKKCH